MMTGRAHATILCALLSSAVGLQWPIEPQNGPETLPNIELSLAPPLHPWPQVAAELGVLEQSRELIEGTSMRELQQEFNKATIDARKRIGDAVGRAMRVFDDPALTQKILAKREASKSAVAFRQAPQEAAGSSVLSVKVDVVPASPPSASLRARIDDIEYQRSASEKEDIFESARAEAKALSDFVVNEFEVQIQRHVNNIVGARASSFLQKSAGLLPPQANVRVVQTIGAYPTVATMVQDMEARRDLSQNLERKRLLEMSLDFVMACNSAAEGALRGAVARIMAQYVGLA